jgi:hypothetical protein
MLKSKLTKPEFFENQNLRPASKTFKDPHLSSEPDNSLALQTVIRTSGLPNNDKKLELPNFQSSELLTKPLKIRTERPMTKSSKL